MGISYAGLAAGASLALALNNVLYTLGSKSCENLTVYCTKAP